jgi:predicted AlkP superfamily phosphohydrolase/phosphomutase
MYQFKLAYTAAESFRHSGMQLYREYKPESFALYFEGIDMISHFFWQYYRPESFPQVSANDVERFGKMIPEYYAYMDDILGEFLSVLEPGTDILVLSDHGFGPDTDPEIPFRTGDHRPYGILVASGPHFKQGVKIERASVLDVTPTLLYLFGLPSASDMDGRVVEEAIEPTFLSSHPPRFIKSYETGFRTSTITRSSADAQMKEQIKALGYTQ